MRQKLCKVYQGWHDLDAPWPDNYRPERVLTRGDFPTPMVFDDIEEYHSPIDGKLITSRSHRREDLNANDCIPWEPGIGTSLANTVTATTLLAPVVCTYGIAGATCLVDLDYVFIEISRV